MACGRIIESRPGAAQHSSSLLYIIVRHPGRTQGMAPVVPPNACKCFAASASRSTVRGHAPRAVHICPILPPAPSPRVSAAEPSVCTSLQMPLQRTKIVLSSVTVKLSTTPLAYTLTFILLHAHMLALLNLRCIGNTMWILLLDRERGFQHHDHELLFERRHWDQPMSDMCGLFARSLLDGPPGLICK